MKTSLCLPRVTISIFMLFLLMVILPTPLRAATDKVEKFEKKVIETPELDSLSNDELLKQAMTVLNEASVKTFARLRALAKSEILLSHARQKTKLPDIPDKELTTTSVDVTDPVELAKIKSEHAKNRLDTLKQKLDLIQTEKALSNEYIKQTDNALSAVQSLINTIDGLYLHTLEIRFRVEDGTLSQEKIPDAVDVQKLNTLRMEMTEHQNDLRKKAEKAHKSQKIIVSRVNDVKKTVIEAETGLSSAEEKHSREMKRQTLEKEYSGQTPEKLIANLSESEEERVLLNGALNLSHSRFIRSKAKADRIRNEIKTHSKPENEKYLQPQAYIRAEEADQAIKAIEEVTTYHNSHIKKLEELATALESLIKQGEVFQGDATVLIEHLFSMQVLTKKLEDAGSAADIGKISANARHKALTQAADSASDLMTEAKTVVQKANDELTRIPGQKKESEKIRDDMKEGLARLKETRDSAMQARQWASELEKLTAEQIISRFQENAEKMLKNKGELDAVRAEVGKFQAAVDEIMKKINMLKDPLLRVAQQESLEEKYNIAKSLHQVANLKFSEKKDTPDGSSQYKKGAVLTVKHDDTPEASLSDNWRNLLSTRSGIVAEKQKLRTELLTALNKLNQKNENYGTVLLETGKLTMQHHATALELKKRLGRKQVGRDEIPDGITDALKQTLVTQIESETAELMNKQTLVKQQTETLSQPDETLEKTQKLLTLALISVGKRLDLIVELKKKELAFERKQDELSETERKQLEHATTRRMEGESTLKEFLLNFFVHSENTNNLTELLRIYYREIIEQEFRQNNLEKRKVITDRLAGLAKAEKTAVSDMLPLLRKKADLSEIRKEEEWVKIRARLMPDKAGELIANFKTRTGRSLSLPPPIREEQKAEAIQKAAAPLFERHIEHVAAEKWIDIFKQRISVAGIEGEIGEYHDKKGALDADALAIQRRMNQLTGHSRSELAKLTPEEKPKSKEDMQQFLKGEIGMLRADRYKIGIQKAIEVLVKLAGILMLAVFIHWLSNFLSGRFLRRSQKSAGGKASGAMVVLPLLKTFFKIFIWMGALLAMLSTLGFNVGAILAGFGIGGIALAMAAKETLSDIMGGISILLSQSFKRGDIIAFNGENNKVEHIGLRYTRLRPNATKYFVTVPNALLAQTEAVNVTEAPGLFININIPLSNRNTQEQVGKAMALTGGIINANPDLKFKFAKFGTFGDYSFVLSVRYIIQNIPARHKLQSELNQEIVRQFRENNIEFAVIPHADANCFAPGSENIPEIF